MSLAARLLIVYFFFFALGLLLSNDDKDTSSFIETLGGLIFWPLFAFLIVLISAIYQTEKIVNCIKKL